MKNLSNLILISIILTIFTSNLSALSGEKQAQHLQAAVAVKQQAYQMATQKSGTPKTVQTPQEKKLLFEQEATDALPNIEAENAKVLSWVNSSQIPDDANRNTALKNVAKNRKYVSILNKQQKGLEYFTLSAWVYYFDDKPDKALKQAVAGQKFAPQNPNIAKTCVALALIYKDYAAASEVFANKGLFSQADESASSSTQKYFLNSQPSNIELNLDVNNIRQELLGKVFDVRPQTASPTKNLMCVLLWKIDSNELDRFAVAEVAVTKGPNEPNSPPPAAAQAPAGSETLQSAAGTQLEAFSKLQSLFAKDSKTVFMGINLNDPAKADNVKNWLAKKPQSWETSMPSAQLQQKITSLFTAVPAKPTLIVIGPDSTIRYTGDVNNFLPQMIIRNISGNPQEFAEPNKPNDANRPPAASEKPVVVVPIKVSPLPPEPNKPHRAPAVREANEIPKPSSQAALPAQTATASADKQQQNDDAFDPRAEQLLETAKGFFKIGDRLQYHTYAKPIEMCRTVIKDYPNTKYAEQARILMRQVPERFRARYDITDQELGL